MPTSRISRVIFLLSSFSPYQLLQSFFTTKVFTLNLSPPPHNTPPTPLNTFRAKAVSISLSLSVSVQPPTTITTTLRPRPATTTTPLSHPFCYLSLSLSCRHKIRINGKDILSLHQPFAITAVRCCTGLRIRVLNVKVLSLSLSHFHFLTSPFLTTFLPPSALIIRLFRLSLLSFWFIHSHRPNKCLFPFFFPSKIFRFVH